MTRNIGTDAVINQERLKQQTSHPASPASGFELLYVISGSPNGGLYLKDSSGRQIGPFITGTATINNPEHDYYIYLAALLEPAAIEVIQTDTFSYPISSTGTKIMTSSWNTNINGSGRVEARNPKMPTYLRGVTVGGLGAGATATFIDPTLPVYTTPRDTYFDRMKTLFEITPSYIPISGTSGIPFLCGAYGAIVLQATNYNYAWIALRYANDVYGMNLDNEISDTTAIRFANVPYLAVNKLICNEVRGESGSGPLGGILYYLVPSTWSVIPDTNVYDFRDDFMGTSLDTATKWTRTQSGGTVEIDVKQQWLKLVGTTTWGNNGCYSQTGIARANGKKFIVDVYTGANATTVNSHMVGFNDGTGQDYVDFSHGLLFTSSGAANILKVYENGNDRGTVGSGYTNRTNYRVRITLGASNNATYEIQGGAYGKLGSNSWTAITPGTTSSATTPLYAGISAGQTGTMYMGDVKIL